jgi:HAD superfamily hydrolase (TIGR01509 family)
MNIGVIFDMDGVIFDTERLWKLAFEEANERYGLNLTEEYRRSTCGKNEADIRMELRERFPSLDVDAYRSGMLRFVMEHIDSGEFEVKSNFPQVMAFLKENGVRTALATSSHKERALKLFSLKNMDVSALFNAAVYSEDIKGRSKPDPFIFLKAAKKIRVLPKNCIVVEDSVNGIEAAYNGGFRPVMAVDLIPADEYCRTHTAAVIRDLSELIGIVGEIK